MTELSEKVIEDILCSNKQILGELLSISPSYLSLIARQKIVASGKLDFLYLCEDELLLIELKVVPFYADIVRQINEYETDLIALQNQNKLIKGTIKKIILVPKHRNADVVTCQNQDIALHAFDPASVLARYYENFKNLTYFLTLQSGDYGVTRLALLNETLRLLSQGKTLPEICQIETKSIKTIRNRLSIAVLLGLVNKFKGNFYLTEAGVAFVEIQTVGMLDKLSSDQIGLLSETILKEPFSSSITYTLFALIESVFILAKSVYPVPENSLKNYFVSSVGKESTWRTNKARTTATYIFSNYALELEFLQKINNCFYITPKGVHAILLLQLNRSIKLIESQK